MHAAEDSHRGLGERIEKLERQNRGRASCRRLRQEFGRGHPAPEAAGRPNAGPEGLLVGLGISQAPGPL